MPVTVRSNLIIPEILQEAVRGEFAGVVALLNSGAAAVSPTLPESARGGDVLKVPYFGTIGEYEDVAEATPLTPANLVMSTDTATVQHSGKAIEITQWAQLAAAYADPYAELARQLRVGFERRMDRALIDAANTTNLVHDVYSATTPRTLNWDVMVDARLRFGDEQEDIALLVVHSKVLGDLLKLKDNDGRPLLVNDLQAQDRIARFAGVPVKVSDRLAPEPVNPPKYTSLLIKRNALALWYNGSPEVQADRDILRDTQVAAVHVYWIAHRYSRMPGSTRTGVVKITHN